MEKTLESINPPINFKYRFRFLDNTEEIFHIKIDRNSLELIDNLPEHIPQWAILNFHQCPHCPLSSQEYPYCPAASNLVNVVTRFERFLSYHEMQMEVITEERIVSQKTTVQRGVSSLLGLINATSGCPHLAYFKPMARFHLPLANEEETIYRASSMYMLAQYFIHKKGGNLDVELAGLANIYNQVKVVNSSIANRLRAASKTDSTLNAIVLLDVYAHTVPYVIGSAMEEINYLFKPYYRHLNKKH